MRSFGKLPLWSIVIQDNTRSLDYLHREGAYFPLILKCRKVKRNALSGLVIVDKIEFLEHVYLCILIVVKIITSVKVDRKLA
jgi:hypothetical protein